MEKCNFCNEQVYERNGGTSSSLTGIGGADFMETLKRASKRKFVCPSCAALFCLECGNEKGKELKTGSTHCPKCGEKVL
jgi:DNA-directed RNA polymerase subunit RPC12/RpoP